MKKFALVLIFLSLAGCEEWLNPAQKVAVDYERQYSQILPSAKAERCVYAGLVEAAWLQADNEAKYVSWRMTRALDCLDYYTS